MGGENEIETQQVPLMNAAQQKMLNQLLAGTMQGMQGYPLGQAYGGPVASSWETKPFMGDEYKKGQAGRAGEAMGQVGGMFGMRGRGNRIPGMPSPGQRPGAMPEAGVQGNANLMAKLLGGPMADTMTQGMTGNIPRFRPPRM